MKPLERTIDIDAPSEIVWAVLADIERWPEWTLSTPNAQLETGGTLGPGSRAKLRMRGALTSSIWQVTEFTEGRSFTWESKLLPGVTAVAGHELVPLGAGSKATLSVAFSGILAPVMGPVLALLSGGNLDREAAGLKRRSEERATGRSDS